MLLETIQSKVAADYQKYDGVSRKEDNLKKAEKVVSKKSDGASISAGSKGVTDVATAKNLVARVESYPDVREEKVNEVRQKINNGYYNRQDFTDNLADRMIEDLGF